jgi:hypothetical protein
LNGPQGTIVGLGTSPDKNRLPIWRSDTGTSVVHRTPEWARTTMSRSEESCCRRPAPVQGSLLIGRRAPRDPWYKPPSFDNQQAELFRTVVLDANIEGHVEVLTLYHQDERFLYQCASYSNTTSGPSCPSKSNHDARAMYFKRCTPTVWDRRRIKVVQQPTNGPHPDPRACGCLQAHYALSFQARLHHESESVSGGTSGNPII